MSLSPAVSTARIPLDPFYTHAIVAADLPPAPPRLILVLGGKHARHTYGPRRS